MIVQNEVITITWDIEKNPLFATYNAAYFDLQITAPSGAVSYFEGTGSWALSFTQPSDTVNGEIVFAYTFTETGVYTLILGTGISTNFSILDNSNVMVVASDTTIDTRLILP